MLSQETMSLLYSRMTTTGVLVVARLMSFSLVHQNAANASSVSPARRICVARSELHKVKESCPMVLRASNVKARSCYTSWAPQPSRNIPLSQTSQSLLSHPRPRWIEPACSVVGSLQAMALLS